MPPPPPHIMLQALGKGYTAERFVLETLRKISARYAIYFSYTFLLTYYF